MDLWEYYEEVFRKISDDPNVAPMTNLELVRYLKAMRSAIITENEIHNPSELDLWFDVHGSIVCISSGTSVSL